MRPPILVMPGLSGRFRSVGHVTALLWTANEVSFHLQLDLDNDVSQVSSTRGCRQRICFSTEWYALKRFDSGNISGPEQNDRIADDIFKIILLYWNVQCISIDFSENCSQRSSCVVNLEVNAGWDNVPNRQVKCYLNQCNVRSRDTGRRRTHQRKLTGCRPPNSLKIFCVITVIQYRVVQ